MIPSCIKEKDFVYNLPSDAWIIEYKRNMEDFIAICKDRVDDLKDMDIEINYLMLFNVFVRIDERNDYFLYFHSKNVEMHMSCEKEAALVAFWIVKYKPFRIKDIQQEQEFYKNFRCTINEMIAALLMVFYVCTKVPSLMDYFTVEKIETLVYDLTNRDISKEALIMYVESFIATPSKKKGRKQGKK